MNILGLGIDLADVDRVRRMYRRYGERFKERCFTDHEWEYAHRYADPSERLAARFAGKEAVMKSLGTGWRRVHWRDVEITGGGAPPTGGVDGRSAREKRVSWDLGHSPSARPLLFESCGIQRHKSGYQGPNLEL